MDNSVGSDRNIFGHSFSQPILNQLGWREWE